MGARKRGRQPKIVKALPFNLLAPEPRIVPVHSLDIVGTGRIAYWHAGTKRRVEKDYIGYA